MRASFAALIAVCALAPVLARAQFQVPGHLPMPPGHKTLPTPHPQPLPVSYALACTMESSAVFGHLWHVSNLGRNTAPSGLHIYVQSGGFIHADFHLSHAMGPGGYEDFASRATSLDHPLTNHDACDVSYDR